MLKQRAGLDMLHVPYRGGAPAMQDMLAGQVDMMYDNISGAAGPVQGRQGAGARRDVARAQPAAPELPTMSEFYPGFKITSWGGLCGPAGLPPAMVEKAAALTKKALASENLKKTFVEQARNAAVDEPGRHRRVPPQTGKGPGAHHQGVGREGGLIAASAAIHAESPS